MNALTTALRPWQQEAFDEYFRRDARDFLAVATPGAGKTTFALVVAQELLRTRRIDRIVIVTPTDHLKSQWVAAARSRGVNLTSEFGRGTGLPADVLGPVVTYAGVAAAPHALQALVSRKKTLAILDEIHHAGDALAWGDAVQETFALAERRLSLTGTPFRTDINPIPFVTYLTEADGVQRSRADFTYSYGDALADNVVRPVLFLAYSGEMTWRTNMGELVTAELSEKRNREVTTAAWRTALDPSGTWMGRVLHDADRRLSEVRKTVPDAGGLVLASDQESARAYAARLSSICSEEPIVIVSDDPQASRRIAEFSASSDRWIVAVRMVSEGVDIPRLMVGVYATSAATPLYFAQAVGRFVRTRRPGETASIFVPSVPRLLELAAELEEERDHVVRVAHTEEIVVEQPARAEPSEQGTLFEAVASDASLHRVVYDGGVFDSHLFTVSDEEEQFLGIPGLLEPEQAADLLRQRHATRVEGSDHNASDSSTSRAALRAELNNCARAYARMKKVTPAQAHAEAIRATGGPPAKQADVGILQARIDYLRQRAVRG